MKNVNESLGIDCLLVTKFVAKLNGDGDEDDGVVVISDDEGPTCDKKTCRSNPNCLNYLGQEQWEDEGVLNVKKTCRN